MANTPLVEISRGGVVESVHYGHAVICNGAGEMVASWGNPQLAIYPRSSAKMIQALPLITSGAADAMGLGSRQFALACASHNGAAIHTDPVQRWLGDLGLDDDALRCGSHDPKDRTAMHGLILDGKTPCQIHNNCSGKHAGFLSLAQHLKAGPDYIEIDHPVQRAVKQTTEEVAGEDTQGWAVDGCSAPNFRLSLSGLARSMAYFATAHTRSDVSSSAAERLRTAMMAHPELVAGEGRACTNIMRACAGAAAVKTGAEGVFIAILPEKGLGVALKISDGATRASECAIATILELLGVLPHEAAASLVATPVTNCRNITTGQVTPSAAFVNDLKAAL